MKKGEGELTGREVEGPRGKVTKGPKPLTAKGGKLSEDAIRAVIAKNLHQVQTCYEKALIKQPALRGRLELEWVIGPSGTVDVVRVTKPDLPSDTAIRCITEKIERWRFPKPTGGSVTVGFPINLEVGH